jgi:hypothetical protein
MTLATVTRAGAEQRIAWLGGSIHHIVLDGSATDGQLMAVRSSMKTGTASYMISTMRPSSSSPAAERSGPVTGGGS